MCKHTAFIFVKTIYSLSVNTYIHTYLCIVRISFVFIFLIFINKPIKIIENVSKKNCEHALLLNFRLTVFFFFSSVCKYNPFDIIVYFQCSTSFIFAKIKTQIKLPDYFITEICIKNKNKLHK